jgi:hypothetical protein
MIIGGGVVSVGILGGGVYWLMNSDSYEFEQANRDVWSSTQTEESDLRHRFTGTLSLPKGKWTSYQLQPNFSATLEIDVDVSEGRLDVLTMTPDEFDRFREEEDDARFYTDLSLSGIESATTITGDITDQAYEIVFLNSSAYGSSPDGGVDSDIVIDGRIFEKSWYEFRDEVEPFEGVTRVDVTTDFQRWIVTYEASGLDEATVTEESRAVLNKYAEYVPDVDYHAGLLFEYQAPSASQSYRISAELARQYQRGEISEEEYFEQVSQST